MHESAFDFVIPFKKMSNDPLLSSAQRTRFTEVKLRLPLPLVVSGPFTLDMTRVRQL